MNIEERLSEKIQSMSREKFEKLCIDLLEKMGFRISTVKSEGGDIQVEASIKRNDETKDYIVKCSRSEDIKNEIKTLEKLIDENINGFILSHQRVRKTFNSEVEVAGIDNFYKLLEKFKLLKNLNLEEEKIVREQINNMMKDARKTLKEGKPREAIDDIIEIIKKDESIKESWFLLSKAYHEIESYQNEIEALEQVIKLDDGYLEAWKSKGEAHYNNENFDEAILSFEKALEIEPESQETWNNIGLCYFKKGELDEALRSLDNALSIDESFVQALMNKALIFEKQGKIEKTTEVSGKLIELAPDNPEYQYIHAAYLYKKEDYKSSLKSINKILEIDPDHKDAQQLKNVLEKQIEIEKTDEMIKENVKKSRFSDPTRQKNISELLWKLDENEKALKVVNEDDEITGCILFERGNIEEGEEIFNKNIENTSSKLNLEEIKYNKSDFVESKNILDDLNTENIVVNEKKALSFIKLKNQDQAIESLENISEKGLQDILEEIYRCKIRNEDLIGEDDWEIEFIDKNRFYNLFSILYLINNKKEESMELLNKVTDIDNPIYYNNLGCILFKMGRFEDALKAFEKSVEKESDSPIYLNNYSFYLIEEDELEEALENLKLSLDIEENYHVTWYYKAIAQKRVDDKNWRESIKRSLEIEPDFEKARNMLE
ncbi:MAG: tetratricopeptide repeat protein [Thermoplasmatota archaeon]